MKWRRLRKSCELLRTLLDRMFWCITMTFGIDIGIGIGIGGISIGNGNIGRGSGASVGGHRYRGVPEMGEGKVVD